jgi:hypothetical protein
MNLVQRFPTAVLNAAFCIRVIKYYTTYELSFGVIMAVIQIGVICVVIPCSLVGGYRHFRGICYLRTQVRSMWG